MCCPMSICAWQTCVAHGDSQWEGGGEPRSAFRQRVNVATNKGEKGKERKREDSSRRQNGTSFSVTNCPLVSSPPPQAKPPPNEPYCTQHIPLPKTPHTDVQTADSLVSAHLSSSSLANSLSLLPPSLRTAVGRAILLSLLSPLQNSPWGILNSVWKERGGRILSLLLLLPAKPYLNVCNGIESAIVGERGEAEFGATARKKREETQASGGKG